MIRAWQRSVLLAIATIGLAACGGGGGGGGSTSPPPAGTTPPPTGTTPPPSNPQPPAPSATAEDTASARASQLSMTLKAENNQLVIAWTDSFTSEAGYQVESRPAAGGDWQMVEALAATNSTGTPYQWQRVIDTSRQYRVTATRDGYTVPLQTADGRSEILVELALPLSLQIDKAEPLRGDVVISLEGATDVSVVSYYIDLAYLQGTQGPAPTFAQTWNPLGLTDGQHLLSARVLMNSGAIVEVSRPVTVDNPAIAATFRLDDPGSMGSAGIRLALEVRATSAAGIQSVEFFANGTSIQVVTSLTDGYYRHIIERSSLPSGQNVFRALVTDRAGETIELEQSIVIDHRPTLSLASPINGAIVSGSLQLQGTWGDDNPGATLSVMLRDVQILSTSTYGAINLSYPLTSLGAGEYTLLISAIDSARKETRLRLQVIVSSTGLTYEPVATAVYEALDTEAGALLYKRSNGAVVLRNAAGTEVTMQVPAGHNSTNWQLDDGYVVMSVIGTGNGVYQFDASGQSTNISQQLGVDNAVNPVLRAPWLVWTNNTSNGGYSIYNLATQAHVTVPFAAPGNTEYDFVTTPGSEQFLFWGKQSLSVLYSDVFRYTLASGTIEALTSSTTGSQVYVQTDNTRMAWEKRGPTYNDPIDMVVASVANPTAQTTYSSVPKFVLRDGTLAWLEGSPLALKVDDGTVTTVSLTATGNVLSVADGNVIFSENGRTYVWNRLNGKQLLLDVLPSRAIVQDDGVAFIPVGYDPYTIQRVALP